MRPNELIGNEIVEIRYEVSKVEYEGSIPLEIIDVEMKLSTGKIISFPHHPESSKIECEQFNPKLKKVFPKKIISKLFCKSNTFEELKGEQINGIWLVEDDFGEEICLIEFKNGSFLAKGSMSPIGTGNANLFLFESMNKIEERYHGELKKVF